MLKYMNFQHSPGATVNECSFGSWFCKHVLRNVLSGRCSQERVFIIMYYLTHSHIF